MGFFRSKQDITDSYGKDNNELIEQILKNIGKDKLPNNDFINFALDKYKTDSEFSIDNFANNFAYSGSKYLYAKIGETESLERLTRLDEIGKDYLNYSASLETTNAKILCEGVGIDTSKFKCNSEKGYNALATLKSENFDIEQFQNLGPNQLDSLYYITSGKYTASTSKGKFLLAGLKDEADKQGSIEIELESGDAISIENVQGVYKYYINGKQEQTDMNIISKLGQENLDTNTLDDILEEKEFKDMIAKNSKGIEQDLSNIAAEEIIKYLFGGLGQDKTT